MRFGYTIFCDDIRYEKSGKTSLIGVYHGNIFIAGEFPQILPRFCMRINVTMPRDKAESFAIKVYFPGSGEPLLEGRIEVPKTDEPRSSLEDPDLREIAVGQQNLELNFVELKEPGYIKVRAEFSDEVVKIGALRVDRMEASAAPEKATKAPSSDSR